MKQMIYCYGHFPSEYCGLVSEWVIHSSAPRYICAIKNNFVFYTQINRGEKFVYLDDSSITQVLGKKIIF